MKHTDEQKAAWRAKMKRIAADVRAMTPEARDALAAKLGTLTCEGRALSPYNTCYLWQQAGRALAMVGGFRQWRKAGRMVRKGQHAVGYIYVPIGGKRNAPDVADGDGDGDGDGDTSVRFRLVPVFDVSQTEPIGADVAETVAA